MKITGDRLLAVYSGVITALFAALLLSGARSPKKANFDEITVQRINIVEPDGTLRLTISNNARFPGTPIKGHEQPRPDRTGGAGLLYMDDEGTEIGGFGWGGKQKDGKTAAFGNLTFDRYNGDENLDLFSSEKNGRMETGLMVNDSYSSLEASLEPERIRALPADRQEAAWKEWQKKYPSTQRLLLARVGDNSVVQLMKDAQGRSRIVLKVAPDGTPSIELLDADGKVTSRLPAGS